MKSVTIVDYGLGNLLSVRRALEYHGARVKLTSNPEKITEADRLILPGVGAFPRAMSRLHDLNLVDPLIRFTKLERPFLGICLGMQMMADASEEFELTRGLGLVHGVVRKIKLSPDASNAKHLRPLKVPHIGWASLDISLTPSVLLKGIEDQAFVYFVHSYALDAMDPVDVSARTAYGGNHLTAAVGRGLSFGTQFHPEKSGPVGLKILSNFLSL